MRLQYLSNIQISLGNYASAYALGLLCLAAKPYQDRFGPIHNAIQKLSTGNLGGAFHARDGAHPFIFVAAKADGRIIGSVVIYHKCRVFNLDGKIVAKGEQLAVYVDPEYRLRGVGRKLVKKALSYASKSSPIIGVAGNASAMGFYNKIKLRCADDYIQAGTVED